VNKFLNIYARTVGSFDGDEVGADDGLPVVGGGDGGSCRYENKDQ